MLLAAGLLGPWPGRADEEPPPPVITVQPVGTAAGIGEPVRLRVGAQGSGFLRFAWLFEGEPIEGAMEDQLLLPAIREDQFGVYRVRVTDAFGSVLSEPALVSPATDRLLYWARQPADARAVVGGPVRFEAEAQGSDSIRYLWRVNGNDVPGANQPVLEIPNVRLADGGRYTVLASTPDGTLESRSVVLEIDVPELPFADAFADRGLLGDASGVGRGSNRGATWEGAAGEPRHAGKRGGRSVWITWRASANGVATFATAGSTFDTVLAVYTGSTPGGLTEVAANDDGGSYLTSVVRFNAVAGTDYQVAVDGFAGAEGGVVLSWDFDPGAPPLPRIAVAPQSEIVVTGGTLNLAVIAEGDGLQYQWLFNGEPIEGEGDALLTTLDVSAAEAGQYSVRVGNSAGQTVESPWALVEVVSGPAAPARDKFEDLFDDPLNGGAVLQGPGGSGFTSVAPGLPGWRDTTNEGATRSPEDPLIFGEVGGASLWFRFRSTVTGWMHLSTEGSAIPTVLGVYTNRFALSVVTESRPVPPRSHAEVVFGAFAGEDYLVMIDGVNGARGPVRLAYSAELAEVRPPVMGLSPAGFSLEMVVPPGTYEILRGDAMSRLSSVATTNVTGGVLRFFDAGASDRPRRFYWIRGVP